jgi:signal transduction histidine kinase
MKRGLSSEPGQFGRVPLIRHLALCVAALVAYAAREELRVGNSVLWVLGFAAILNFQFTILPRRLAITSAARSLSVLFGMGGWTALTSLTGGVASPFIAGLSLEVILAAMTSNSLGIAWIAGGAVAGLWFQQALLGISGFLLALTLHTAFLIVLGSTTGFVIFRWRRREEQLSRRQTDLQRRLESLERDLSEARTVGRLGENAARLAHGLKGAAHSLHGFARLMEPRFARSGRDRELVGGLRTAIEGLEDLARTTLGPSGPRTVRAEDNGAEVERVVREVVREMAATFPNVHCSLSLAPTSPVVAAPASVLREVLTIVVRNAAEAMQGQGEVVVEATPRDGHLDVLVRDHGPGMMASDPEKALGLGSTSKPQGHGYGLFLARRLLEAQGGLLRMSSADGGGTLCRIELPLGESQSAQ